MHALTILHNIVVESCPEVHAKRITSLLAAVEAVISGSRLALSDLGRALPGPVAVKHNIKRIDRLLGNGALHAETAGLYDKALARQHLAGVATPLIIIDWSDLTPDRRWQLLRASMALEGRSITLYEQVHPESCAAAPRVHKAFLARLSTFLPPGCIPILITDAGFRGPWFKLVNKMGWYWIRRIRNRDMVRSMEQQVMGRLQGAVCQGQGARSVAWPIRVRAFQSRILPFLVLIKRACQGRHKKGRLGKVIRSRHEPEECPLPAGAMAFGRMPETCSLKCQGGCCRLCSTHADRGELSRSEE